MFIRPTDVNRAIRRLEQQILYPIAQAKINNIHAFDIYQRAVNVNEYGEDKVKTLKGFQFIGTKNHKKLCTCFGNDIITLWNRGCQCGGI